MSDPTFGISITRIDNEPRPAVYSDMSVVGLIGTAPEADAPTVWFRGDGPITTPIDDTWVLHPDSDAVGDGPSRAYRPQRKKS